MKRFSIILPFFIGTLVYCIVSICVGPRGIWSMSQLEKEKNRLEGNLTSLHVINDDLDAQFKNLSADPDTIQIYAHELGYVSQNEKLIKLAGFSGGINRNLVAGTVAKMNKPVFLPEWLCKIFGILAGILSFFLFSRYLHRRQHNPEKEFA